jgi:hypothetical protein
MPPTRLPSLRSLDLQPVEACSKVLDRGEFEGSSEHHSRACQYLVKHRSPKSKRTSNPFLVWNTLWCDPVEVKQVRGGRGGEMEGEGEGGAEGGNMSQERGMKSEEHWE